MPERQELREEPRLCERPQQRAGRRKDNHAGQHVNAIALGAEGGQGEYYQGGTFEELIRAL